MSYAQRLESEGILEKNELEAIERYVDQGGNALFLMDPGFRPENRPDALAISDR